MKTQKRNATIGEALVYGDVPSYGEMAVMTALMFSLMFAVMGFINSDKLGLMGAVGLTAVVVLAAVWAALTYKRVKSR